MIAARIGQYEVTSKLGEGGMGEVWRATDARLGREAALKVLPEDFAADPERLARFEREARVLASLNHPNIATLYGLESAPVIPSERGAAGPERVEGSPEATSASGPDEPLEMSGDPSTRHPDGRLAQDDSRAVTFLVMELVEGEDLAQRIARGPVPVDEAITIARQVADALEAAHEAGIVHRDLKPANIRIRPDGTVKVLDFGLAKSWESESAASGLSLSPTVTSQHTRAGVILGTAAYMSPEQARGKPVDKRSDIWAFGVVLWEMLTGRTLFEGEMVTDVLANVLKEDVDWSLLPASTPAGLRRLLRRCLARQPAERIRDIGDVRWELAEIARSGGGAAAATVEEPAAERPRWRAALPWVAGAVLGVVATALTAGWLRPAPKPPRAVRSFVLAPENAQFDFRAAVGGPVLSPDGTKLVFAARDDSGGSSLWVRPLDSLSAQPLGGTEGAFFPFWSPDSRWVGYFVKGKLQKIDASGGPPETLCEAPAGRGGSWSSEGMIVFAPDVFGGLLRVSAAGGVPSPISALDASKQQTSQRWPVFLPDGRHFLYWGGSPLNSGEVQTDGIYVGSLEGNDPKFLFPADSNALYSPPGYLLFLRAQTLMVQPFDAEGLTLSGDAFPVAESIANPQNYRLGDFSVSQEGTLVYQTGETGLTQVEVRDSAGRQIGTVGESAAIDSLRLSPGGAILAEQVSDARSKNVDLWLVDLERGVRTRFTFEPGLEISPAWSPSGDRIAFSANPGGHLDLFVKNANGAGQAETLVESEVTKFINDWSPDGLELAVTALDPHSKTVADIWIIPLSGDHAPKPFLATPFNESNAVFSPNGHWLAYQSDESGRMEIFVTPYPGPGGKWQVSQNGGAEPEWRRDGGALYFRSPDNVISEVAVTDRGAAVEVGTPKDLFQVPAIANSGTGRTFDVAPDGSRFFVLRPIQSTAAPLTLVTHWTSALRK